MSGDETTVDLTPEETRRVAAIWGSRPMLHRLVWEEQGNIIKAEAAIDDMRRLAEAAYQAGREAESQSSDCDCPAFVSLLTERDRAHQAGRQDAARAVELLADLIVKCTQYGVQDGEFVAMYLLPTGPVHRAIPWLEEHGVIVRPGFDGRNREPS